MKFSTTRRRGRREGAGAPKLAVVSSSRNARPVLEAAGLLDRFELIVDGNVAHDLELDGKPSPATYLYAAEQLAYPRCGGRWW